MSNVQQWPEKIRQRYENYLKTSFFFKDPKLRDSFKDALRKEGQLLKGPFPESSREFKKGSTARDLARKYFPDNSGELLPALFDDDKRLHVHQEHAIHATHVDCQNVVVATGTASGKTESFLYPILFDLYRQYLHGRLKEPGVRAMILYPMNALANDQRQRLGYICEQLKKSDSDFGFTFGQYIGQTPQNKQDFWRKATDQDEPLPGELIYREEMRDTPPHILLTNYSMLEYLLIRPEDNPLFGGTHWQFIVLDEAHQYRGAKGMEMGMLIRRLKQRLREGGRQNPFRCIATSATISSGEGEKEKQAVAEFAKELFGEPFSASNIIFGELQPAAIGRSPRRYHAFLRALEGAFIAHRDGSDTVVLNRKKEINDRETNAEPLEIALCRECGQHYYVGQERDGKLQEAVRDPSHPDFGVEYYLPVEDPEEIVATDELLCRQCGTFSKSTPICNCGATIGVRRCESHKDHADQLKQCEVCDYKRGGIGDPVQEIVHGSDGPNAVIATALHELLPENSRKVLAFADSRQEAAFFAWYAQDSYEKLRDRNFILRAIKAGKVGSEGLSIEDLKIRLRKQWEQAGLFRAADYTGEKKDRQALLSILQEVLTDERRISLSGVGLVKWFVHLPSNLSLPQTMQHPPWNFTDDEARHLIGYLLDELRPRRAMNLPEGVETPTWSTISPWPQQSYRIGPPGKQKYVSEWGGSQSAVVKHFLHRLLTGSGLSSEKKQLEATELMKDVWRSLRKYDTQTKGNDPILSRGGENGAFRLNPRWLRVKLPEPNEIWECDTCAILSSNNIRGICPRNHCPGNLKSASEAHFKGNHYRILYENAYLPPALEAAEHTAQIDSDEAHRRQDQFKGGDIHLLSSSTTFEIGVDLGDLEAVFLRNVPPETFNYTQRVGRAGRRDEPGLALTYCRRNPHDLYHYEDPENRIIKGIVNPPRLRMTNEKIILRHMVATVLSAFFRDQPERFKTVENFVGDWSNPQAASALTSFCESNDSLKRSLCQIVPSLDNVHGRVGLDDNTWIRHISGPKSRFADVEAEICSDYINMCKLRKDYFEQGKDSHIGHIRRRMKTIASENTLAFLSRKAVIPKYGFPVDVVELDTRSGDGNPTGVSLQRDLSQAIAEYAPGGKVVANKREWESCGVKVVYGKEWEVRYYTYDNARTFEQWKENESVPYGARAHKYLIPQFGFVTPMFKKPKEPRGKARRLYTTRPFFGGFERKRPETKTILGVRLTKAVPGTLVILCEGSNRKGFYICRNCGAHMTEQQKRGKHKSPLGSECQNTLEHFSLGQELVTDVMRLQFPQLRNERIAYSVAYALLLGVAETLNVPDTDLNVTITGSKNNQDESAIVLYDNFPGGAGLVAQLEQEDVFGKVLDNAKERIEGGCGCDSSCYGCLRSYRNQFAHPYLDRKRALDILSM